MQWRKGFNYLVLSNNPTNQGCDFNLPVKLAPASNCHNTATATATRAIKPTHIFCQSVASQELANYDKFIISDPVSIMTYPIDRLEVDVYEAEDDEKRMNDSYG
ncbi:uncharacterized protein EAE97_011698 [Botrytis byssoidea]|uniref:Uncharacterized protein n=1 Tax=Botrytis byssoidea TaxID=139641 RepID=A0A9P5HSW9_9HELO|nr:uncharacterized protein EAE97_011698 [Botrytis byssoidea]KAF7919366.1 hypothetical protein EAE97_011698 [Botrytis byssoidea]